MLVDEAEVIIKGGHGGPGKVSFFPPPMKGPDGGNGGRGGDVYLLVTSDLSALRPFTTKRLVSAENGQPGGSNRKFGLNGKDLEILIPLGSILKDINTGEEIELDEVGLKILICKGGKGGRGNFEFKSSRNTTPKIAQPGLPGEEKHFKISLKLIADIGLIGLPNAGKSSLLNELTRAQAKIADYPFTTLEPNLGVLHSRHPDPERAERDEGEEPKVIADIPGLIEGASSGKGLGIKFLKHIEKVSLLLHCISAESEDIVKDYQTIKAEMEQYSSDLMSKSEIILLTKSDLVDKEKLKKQTQKLKKFKKEIYSVSIHDWEALEKLKRLLS